ncbi:C40 family peptidase [Spirosoma agri]|uniref:TIGR02594 family protein n=1 Tax=Spirosoma agri TaxID=1987381 RepID=A0A6M0IJB2_9BACT|nr:hypothetical protein [Spirosoma agri]NEU67063.1 hypothetical protein [Spirosoma agri]
MLETASSQAHVKEKSNRNDHPQIDAYFKAIGWPHPERVAASAKPWCGAFVGWVLKQCAIQTPKGSNLAAVAAYNAMKKLHLPAGSHAIPGDVVTYRTWSHVEFVTNWPLDPRIRVFYAVGGNTTAGNSIQGVYVNIPRPKNYVRHIVRLIPEV